MVEVLHLNMLNVVGNYCCVDLYFEFPRDCSNDAIIKQVAGVKEWLCGHSKNHPSEEEIMCSQW